MSTTEGLQSIDLVRIGEASTAESWLVSDWAAGQTTIMEWSTNNVVAQSDGSVQFSLSAAPEGSAYAYCGGAVKSCEVASVGTWSWTAQAPVMQDGAVFGLFTYRADPFNDPWLEFDFEFVGADTTKIQLNIHMETSAGEHVTLEQANSWQPVIVDLGFDAAQGMHTYDITVSDTEAIFLVDGQIVGRFGAADMPLGTWITGDMKGVTSLWCVDPRLEFWAGDWAGGGASLVATVASIDVRPGDLSAFDTKAISGDAGDNVLVGTKGGDFLDGRAGDDTLTGNLGNDIILAGDGNDRLILAGGNDTLNGGADIDWVRADGSAGATIDLAITVAQDTGYGLDTLINIENAQGSMGADRLSGNDRANVLRGGAGNDSLGGQGGDDRLEGGDGGDRFSLDGGHDTLNGGSGSDWIEARGAVAMTIDLARTDRQATGYGTDVILSVENVAGGSRADKLFGANNANTLKGHTGDDLLCGRGSKDSLIGGAGDDRLEGGSGNDSLRGDGGDDRLYGGSGADRLNGGVGKDRLYAGKDNSHDVFDFNSTQDSRASARDILFDFDRGEDDIDLRDIDARTGGDNNTFGYSGTKAAAYSVWWEERDGDVVVSADVTGDRTADFQLKLVDLTRLSSDDFLL